MNSLEDVVIESKRADLCYKFAYFVHGFSTKGLENVVINSNNLKIITQYANVPDANKDELALKILESKNPKWNYLFVRDVYGCDKGKHGKVIMESLNPEYNYKFAKNIKGVDVIGCGDAVVKSEDVLYNYLFARNIKEANAIVHRDLLLKIFNDVEKVKLLNDRIITERCEVSKIRNKILSLTK